MSIQLQRGSSLRWREIVNKVNGAVKSKAIVRFCSETGQADVNKKFQ